MEKGKEREEREEWERRRRNRGERKYTSEYKKGEVHTKYRFV